jgi:Protein of unknown function (DUF3105)
MSGCIALPNAHPSACQREPYQPRVVPGRELVLTRPGRGEVPRTDDPGEDVTMRVRPAALPVLVVAVVVSLLGACGGDDGDDTASDGNGDEAAQESTTSPAGEVQVGVVQTFEDLSQDHAAIGETITYDRTPPVGGEHWEAWQDCGFYDEPVRSEAAVHSMEHGAVWITYRPDLPDDQVEQIRTFAEQPYVLASPWEDDSLPVPVVLSAWGAQLMLESLPDPAADEFMATYRESPDSPEPGAPCTNGIPLTAAEVEEQLG